MAHSMAASPSASSRVLGLAGILGGAILLAAYVVDIAPELNVLRLILFNIGAMAIVVGVHRRQASGAPRLALAAAVPAFVANGWYLAMILISLGRSEPAGAGAFGAVFFAAGVAMWWADAWFAIVTLRLGVVTRLGAAALAIGSVLVFLGIDRLGLTSDSTPTIIGALALVGGALNGIGWILLGFDLAIRRQAAAPVPGDVHPAG